MKEMEVNGPEITDVDRTRYHYDTFKLILAGPFSPFDRKELLVGK